MFLKKFHIDINHLFPDQSQKKEGDEDDE